MTSLLQQRPLIIAGPCVLEDGDVNLQIAEELLKIRDDLDVAVVYKASFDKANRARLISPRGPGLEKGLSILRDIGEETGLPLLTDVHEVDQIEIVAEVVDVLQIPAFLSRQTDLLTVAGAAGKSVNIKKGQWLQPADMAGAVEKVRASGCDDVAVTERGTFFGYGDLVVDMRNFGRLKRATGSSIIFDVTHSVQQPGRGRGGTSGGTREHVLSLVAAAAAAGADGFFVETHPNPELATSDAATVWPLDDLARLLDHAVCIWQAARDSTRYTEASVEG